MPSVATRLVHIVIDAADPSFLARFWSAALGWVTAADEPAEAVIWPSGFSYPGPQALPLVFVPVSEPKTAKNRVHLDLASQSLDEQRTLVRRLRDLGARPVDIAQRDVPWKVLADPEGNEFCVLEPRAVYRDTGPVAAVVIDSADPSSQAAFWAVAAGWSRCDDRQDIAALRSVGGTGPYLEFLSHTAAKSAAKNRLHLDVAPLAGTDQAAVVTALRNAGAVPADVGQGDEVSWTVLADPEGNEFCVLSPR